MIAATPMQDSSSERRRWLTTAVLALAAATVGRAWQSAPTSPQFSPTGPNASAYGEADGYPVGTSSTLGEQRSLVGAFSHFDELFAHRTVGAGGVTWPYRRADVGQIRYRHNGQTFTLDDYMQRLPVTGLLIAKDDQILTERYQYGRTDRDRFTSQSMSRTIVALLVGAAVGDGRIASVDDRAGAYVPDLRGSAYGDTSIRDLLHMSSGVTCPNLDASPALLKTRAALDAAALARGCSRTSPPNTTFSYSAVDSEVLGLVARHALGQPLATALQDRIWKPMGAEAAAEWSIDGSGQEAAFCCFNAVLRDYARLGRLLANDGSREGASLLPKPWLLDATTMSEKYPLLEPGRPGPFFGYGYQVWILPDERRMFCLLGGNGQRVFVDPQAKLVMVQTAVETSDIDRDLDGETIGLWLSLIAQFGH